jgi:L-ascorbate metabolism protein UlaG (beta-lactamase superfamily)
MGVLLDGGGLRVVIDGLHRGALRDYAALLPEVQVALEGARPPHERLDVILATHRHLDHYQAEAVAERLKADPHVVFLAAAETVDSLFAAAPQWRGNARVVALGGGASRTVNGVVITALELPHNPTASRGPANLGFIVELNGVRVLHVGDAHPSAPTYRALSMATRRIDAAIVPFWYLTERETPVVPAIGARRLIASHVPLADTTSVRSQVLAGFPSAAVLTTRGMRVMLP